MKPNFKRYFEKSILGILSMGAIASLSPQLPRVEAADPITQQQREYIERAQAARRGQQPLIQTDITGVLNARSEKDATGQIFLPPGLYHLGPQGEHDTDAWLFVEQATNNDAKGLGILIPKAIKEDSSRKYHEVYLYEIRPNRTGTAMLLSPVVIDEFGELSSLAKTDTDMPYLEIKRIDADGKNRHFPYIISSWNEAMKDRYGSTGHLEMRPTKWKTQTLEKYPRTGIFNGVSDRNHTMLVNGDTVELKDQIGLSKLRMVAMNSSGMLPGFDGTFFNLADVENNSITGDGVADTEVKMMAVYMKGCLGLGNFLVMQPVSGSAGKFTAHLYSPERRTLTDLLFPFKGL